ncbi:unnamed protein product [Orchesella dallaii]|uniref:F-box domain-containing protein n=1 Tax=Orchesella dallaii TaxID=48710 RepID=A0ABP1S8X1_9HEXA
MKNRKKQKKLIKIPFILQLPCEILDPIINLLPLNSALHLRLTCHSLNTNVETFYKKFKMDLCAENLSPNQLHFISRIHLQKITFKRVAKPLPRNPAPFSDSDKRQRCNSAGSVDDFDEEWRERCNLEHLYYTGPSQYFQVGGIQVRSLSAPFALATSQAAAAGAEEARTKSPPHSHPNYAGGNKNIYNFSSLQTYLLELGSENIFDYVLI